MNRITKVSDIEPSDMFEHLGVADYSETDVNKMWTYLQAAKVIVQARTLLPNIESLDKYPSLVVAVLLECSRIYDNKMPDDHTGKESPVLEAIYKPIRPKIYIRKQPEEDKKD